MHDEDCQEGKIGGQALEVNTTNKRKPTFTIQWTNNVLKITQIFIFPTQAINVSITNTSEMNAGCFHSQTFEQMYTKTMDLAICLLIISTRAIPPVITYIAPWNTVRQMTLVCSMTLKFSTVVQVTPISAWSQMVKDINAEHANFRDVETFGMPKQARNLI